MSSVAVAAEVPPDWRKDLKIIRRAALTAIALRLMIGVLKSIAKCGLSRKLITALRDEALGKDPWKWAIVFAGWACFAPLSRAIEALARHVMPVAASEHFAAIASGCLVAQPIRVMEVSTRTELGLYLLSRATHSVASAEVLPRLPAPLRDFGHWDAFFVGLSGAQILYSLVFEPQTHLASYRAFLERCVMIPRPVWDVVAAFHRAHMTPTIIQCFNEHNVPAPSDVSNMRVVCQLVHPHTNSCDVNVLGWLARHIVKFCIPLYLPLKIFSTVAFGSKKFLKDPASSTLNIAKSVARSSLFLSLYCGGPMRVLCLYNQMGLRNPASIAFLAGISTALATLIETKSRRLDLALYCNMHAFRAAVLLLVRRGYLNPPRRRHVMFMYTAALTTLLYYFRFKPEGLHPNVKTSLGFLLGAHQGHHHAAHDGGD